LTILRTRLSVSPNNWRKQDFSDYITAKVKKYFGRFNFFKFKL
jgi:hypothetical protein